MIEKKWESNGKEGVEYKLEAGDVVKPTYSEPYEVKGLKFPKHIIGCEWNGKEIVLTLTQTQANQMKKLGDVKGVELIGSPYESHGRNCVGINLNSGGEDKPQPTLKQPLKIIAPKPKLSEYELGLIPSVKSWIESGYDEKTILFNLVEQTELTEEGAKRVYVEAQK